MSWVLICVILCFKVLVASENTQVCENDDEIKLDYWHENLLYQNKERIAPKQRNSQSMERK